MPIFEYTCRDCDKQFELLVNGGSKPRCPGCQSARLEKRLSTFAVATGSARKSQPASAGPCGSCGDPRGPGACELD